MASILANKVLVAYLDSAIQERGGAKELTNISIFPSLRLRDALLTEVKDVPLALWAAQSGDLEIVMWFEYLAERVCKLHLVTQSLTCLSLNNYPYR